ncbi:cap-specific mRNA (nucleoside-2'-O-)-methyltransferase 2-like [Mya arenaria]|uniref:cap-specific mRNA (nucleoside-2'-O-)-methyltransferase 2-like n=1 Tax=Mya arenaria TaxID=6604 RepID=UPI0022E8C4E5|nr:cap-specific mRNA (nucleoside-2'-O-)-methyltransferase 2-like [Mya arenaria]
MEFFQVYHRKRKRDQSERPKLSHSSKNFIDSVFEKKITYSQSRLEVPTLNKGLEEKWNIPEYMEMKERLNTLKTNLNDKDMITWHDHTRNVNLAGKIGPEIRQQLRPELCTQAWCKFYEIASTFLEINTHRPFCSVHLCEAPGAFVTSLNQYLFTQGFQSEWQWLASTLNPYYEGNNIAQMIDEDRFIKFTYGNWYFGEDNTGNLMSEKNLSGLMSKLKDDQVDLVTADGSVDCQFNPAEQENVVSRLQHCEVIAGLHILRPGGMLVVKMFTLLECTSVCLMYLLSSLFEELTVFKPCTSKGGNSEVYVVGKGYKGRQSCNTLLEQLVPLYFGENEPKGCLFPLSAIPKSFLYQHTKCVQFFIECQMSAIQRNLDLFKVMTSEERSNLEAEKDYCVECFFNKYDVRPLNGGWKIMKLPKNHRLKVQGKRREFADKAKLEGKFIGSFQERQELLLLPWKQKVVTMETYEEEVEREDNSLWIQNSRGPLTDDLVWAYQPVTGASVEKIESSKFCPGFYLAQTQEVIKNVQCLSSIPNPPEEFAKTVAKKLIAIVVSCLQYHSGVTFDDEQQRKTCNNGLSESIDSIQTVETDLNEKTDVDMELKPGFVCELYSISPDEEYKSTILMDVVTKTSTSRHIQPVPRVLTLVACSSKVTPNFEVKDCSQMLKTVIHILQTVKEGDTVLIEMGTCLTRFTAGLVYILYKSFIEVGFVHNHGLLLQRHLVCIKYQSCPIGMQEYLGRLGHSFETDQSDQSESILEILPVMDILEDDDFCEFLKITNTNLLQSFVTTVVQREKQLLKSDAE